MSNIINVFSDFFKIQDWRLIVAGSLMITLFILIIYLLYLFISSVQLRKKAVNIHLPDIDEYDNNESKEGFTDEEIIAIELMSASDDVVSSETLVNNEDAFLTALILESKQYIPKPIENISMPEIEVADYETIKQQKKEQELQRIKNIAKADNEFEDNYVNIRNDEVQYE